MRRLASAACLCLCLALPAPRAAAEGAPEAVKALAQGPAVIQLPTLTQDAAEKIVAAARKKAEQTESGVYAPTKCKMHVYVVGREGTAMASTQALGAWPGSADIAQRKARTAWLFKLPTRTIGTLSRQDQPAKAPLYGIEGSNGGLITFPGGLPLFDENKELLGAIGVSGDTVDKDEEVAQAGVDEAKNLGKNAVAQVPSLSQAGAALVLHAAMAKAAGTKSGVYDAQTKMHIYILGREGTVLAATQANGAWPGSADIAQRKARTSWFFKLPSGVIGALSRQDKEAKAPLYGIEVSNGGLITFPGGLPIFDANKELIGAIGVSGDTVEKDHEVAQAGAEAVKP